MVTRRPGLSTDLQRRRWDTELSCAGNGFQFMAGQAAGYAAADAVQALPLVSTFWGEPFRPCDEEQTGCYATVPSQLGGEPRARSRLASLCMPDENEFPSRSFSWNASCCFSVLART